MSSLLQFGGTVTRAGVHLQFVKVVPCQRWPDSETLGDHDPDHVYTCGTCGRTHARIYIAVRKPIGMFGCWVVFRYNGDEHVPDLSLPISVFKLPRDAKPLSDVASSAIWHSS